MNRRDVITALATLPAALALPGHARAEETVVCAEEGVALRGADVVSYFTQGALVPGQAAHALRWRGVAWHFAGPETMAAFEMDPLAFCPQFGGYCAYAMGQGIVTHSDPRAFLVQDGSLYLCSNPLALVRFQRDLTGNIAAAQANWPAVLDR